MKEVYPIVEGKYRFLGGWINVPKQLQELIVGHGYDIEESGREFVIRGTGKLLTCTKADFDYYFEPFVDYYAEPTIIYEEGDVVESVEPVKEVKRTNTLVAEVQSLRIASSDVKSKPKPKKKSISVDKKIPKEEIDVNQFLQQLSLF